MADETTILIETAPPVPYTCADNAGIAKGAILMITDPNTVAVTTGDGDAVIGIAATEKIANDGVTEIAVWEEGRFRGTAGAAGVTVGKAIQTDTGTGSANELVDFDNDTERGAGIALETATDRQTFKFKLAPISLEHA